MSLAGVPAARQRGLIDWAYAIADAAIRSGDPARFEAPTGFPYEVGVG